MGDGAFYTSDAGRSFHTKRNCAGHTNQDLDIVTIEEAVMQNLSPCGQCIGENARNRYRELIGEDS